MMGPRRVRFRHKRMDLVCTGLAVAILGLAFWFGVRPVLHSGDDVRRLAGQVTNSRSQLETKRVEYRTLLATITKSRRDLEALAIELDSSDQLSSRQEGIERVLRQSGVTIEQFTVGAVQPGELLDVVPLRVNGEGASPRVIAAMHALRKRFPDLAITSFQIAAGGGANGEQKVVYGFDIAWYIASDGTSSGEAG